MRLRRTRAILIGVLRCLIVDDSPRFLDAASGLLERQGIAVVGVASTGREALDLTRELDPDVVLVDIGLEHESGFDVARSLAPGGRGGRPKVILISTHAEDEFADLIATSPAEGFLAKSGLSAHAIADLLAEGPAASASRPA